MGHDPVILVTGAGGQLGRALAAVLPDARFLRREDLDVTHREDVERALRQAELVFHLAALTDVDGCEADPERAWEVNAEGTRHVVDAVRGRGRVIFLSTDYVFDGAKAGEYDEDDGTNPLNHYGRSKLAAESHVLASPENLVVRASWVIGEGRNFVRTILGAARVRDRLQVVNDQRGRPTFTGPLARALVALARSDVSGTVHLSGTGPATTWFELARAALDAAAIDTPVDAIDSETYARSSPRPVAPRPANSLFSLRRARALDLELPDWRTSLHSYVTAAS